MSNNLLLAALEHQQMLDRERAVVQNLHNQGLCLGDGCIICKEEKMSTVVETTLKDRGQEYGDYANMSQVAQTIKDAFRLSITYYSLPAEHRESLDLIATKMARIVCGNPRNLDSWHDIQGYAKLIEDRCPPPDSQGAPTATP